MLLNNPRKVFPIAFILIILMMSLAVSGLGQSLYPKKDLIFTQVFAGPYSGNTYTASIAVTNRGTLTYNGTLLLATGANGALWTAVVNGQESSGMVDVSIPPDSTQVFLITDTTFTVGYAFFLSEDWSLDNHIEGNLTYFTLNGSTLMDAVGVPESQEFLITSLPFDYFPDVGLSLAHPDINMTGLAANVNVLLFDEDGNAVGTCDFSIAPGGHVSTYLSELPWTGGIPSGFGPIGKVEISCDQAISGICMLISPGSAAGAQISTLPLGGTPLNYAVEFTGTGVDYKGDLTLWIEGFYVKGYLKLTSINGLSVADSYRRPILVNGQLIGTELDLSFFTGPSGVWPNSSDLGVSLYMYVWSFTPGSSSLSGYWGSYNFWDAGTPVSEGTLTLDNTLGILPQGSDLY